MSGIYDWEFDGSVDFAPYNYRMGKYKDCEKLGEQIKDEETAIEYLKAFEYIDYLAETRKSEIPNWNILVGYEEMALSLLKTKEVVFEYMIYPQQYKDWKQGFDKLRAMEKYVIGKNPTITIEEYQEKVLDFNERIALLNKINKEKYNSQLMSHNLYWVQNRLLEVKMRSNLDFPKDFDEKITFLKLHGVLDGRVDYRR